VTLILGRALQGVGAAPMLPLSLAIVCNAFPGQLQARALGIWAGVSALALGIGPLAGGALIEVDWRLIFWINLPVAAVGIAITAAAAPESTDPGSGRRVDGAGLLALSVGLTAVVLALVQSRVWDGPTTAAIAAAGLVVLGLFWRIEHKVDNPIVDFSLFRNRPYLGSSAAAFALVGAYWTVMFFQPQYLQSVRGNSAVEAGLLILPVTVPMIFISPLSGRLIARFGVRGLMTAGMALGTAGLVVLTQVDANTPYGVLLGGYLLFGIAIGLVYAPMSTAAMAAMPPDKAGVASGVLAMDRVIAGAVTLAAVGAVFHALDLDHGFSYAIARASWVTVGLTAVGTALTWAFVRDPEEPRPHSEPAPEHCQHHRRFHL
jgi:MFS family permease